MKVIWMALAYIKKKKKNGFNYWQDQLMVKVVSFTCYPSVDFIEVVIKLISFVGETIS